MASTGSIGRGVDHPAGKGARVASISTEAVEPERQAAIENAAASARASARAAGRSLALLPVVTALDLEAKRRMARARFEARGSAA
jgi:hypothetical protein